jgi:hypothetical protein
MTGMRDLETVLNDLQYEIKKRLELQAELNDLPNQRLSPGKEDEERQKLTQRLQDARSRCLGELDEALTFSPRHLRHRYSLDNFWKDGSYETSVFIMTKFPEAGKRATAKDAELQGVLDAVSKAVRTAGFQPRVARGVTYHPLLWDNVELHLLGCARGVAIVEDTYLPELNPNVAMEWGWMRATTKPVLFLIEETFTKMRADLEGLCNAVFSWADPDPGISVAVAEFLQP